MATLFLPTASASTFAFTLALALAGTPAPAHADGVIDLNQDCATSGCFAGDAPNFPITINQPGHYRLTSDLAPPANTTAIVASVPSGHVWLDLNGFTVKGDNTCPEFPIPVTSCEHVTGVSGLTLLAAGGSLRNGTVRGFRGNGVRGTLNGGFLIEDVSILENGNDGLALNLSEAGFGLVIRNSRFVRNGGSGYADAFGEGADRHTQIEDSLFVGNAGQGARVAGGTIVRSTFHQNGGAAAGFGNCRIIDSYLYFNNNGGAQISQCLGAGNFCASGTC